jgi:apolipoprotein D and lipocalin family protein
MKTALPLSTLLVLLSLTVSTASEKIPPLETIKSVDLKKYAGLWYEISKIPNRFQKKCAGGTTAEYTLLDNGKVRVINRCREADGKTNSANGVARVVDKETNAKLQVSFVRFFGRNWFWGDYWIIGLDEDYQWAIVGHPKRKYGWILARTPKLGPEALKKCNGILREKGYNPANFVATEQ